MRAQAEIAKLAQVGNALSINTVPIADDAGRSTTISIPPVVQAGPELTPVYAHALQAQLMDEYVRNG
jgi:hypothetical protein